MSEQPTGGLGVACSAELEGDARPPKASRANIANELLRVIAACGRQFFSHDGRVACFDVDGRGHVWFVDAYSQKRIYTHYRYNWRGFTNGGTLRALVENLRDYIRTGEPPSLGLGPWPAELCGGDLWGYGTDMQRVRTAAVALGLAPANASVKATRSEAEGSP